jgi:hypothetical protein
LLQVFFDQVDLFVFPAEFIQQVPDGVDRHLPVEVGNFFLGRAVDLADLPQRLLQFIIDVMAPGLDLIFLLIG